MHRNNAAKSGQCMSDFLVCEDHESSCRLQGSWLLVNYVLCNCAMTCKYPRFRAMTIHRAETEGDWADSRRCMYYRIMTQNGKLSRRSQKRRKCLTWRVIVANSTLVIGQDRISFVYEPYRPFLYGVHAGKFPVWQLLC